MYHQILQILADGQEHTAEQLIEQLAVSATALTQAIHTLETSGVKLHYSPVANTYRLNDALELLDKSCILAALPACTRKHLADVEILDIVDSTNRYALGLHTATPFACAAEYQTAGRGRQGRQWISPYASGLCLSIKHRYAAVNGSLLAGLNIALAVTVMRVLHTLGAVEVGLKWPNDVLWRGRKLAGLLLETRLATDCEVVIGIGLNVKMPCGDTQTISQPWVDLYTVLGRTISRNTLAAMLIDQCLQTLLTYPQVGLAAFQDEWHRVDLSYGQWVTLKIPHRSPALKDGKMLDNHLGDKALITGTAWGIDEQGALLLQVGDQIQRYVSGEVSLRL